jgi:hypothetical protein
MEKEEGYSCFQEGNGSPLLRGISLRLPGNKDLQMEG